MPLRRLKNASNSDREGLIEELKKFLYFHEGVIFAHLHGSMVAPDFQEKYGDIDLSNLYPARKT